MKPLNWNLHLIIPKSQAIFPDSYFNLKLNSFSGVLCELASGLRDLRIVFTVCLLTTPVLLAPVGDFQAAGVLGSRRGRQVGGWYHAATLSSLATEAKTNILRKKYPPGSASDVRIQRCLKRIPFPIFLLLPASGPSTPMLQRQNLTEVM